MTATAIVVDQGPRTRLEAARTLQAMQLRVRQELALPIVWETARWIVRDVTPRFELEQARQIRHWCASRFLFVNDPAYHQLLTTPAYCLQKIRTLGKVQGNCADAAMLTAALCLAIRIPAAFIAVAFQDPRASYSHVFTMAYPRVERAKRAIVEMDITRPPQVRRANFSRRLKLEV